MPMANDFDNRRHAPGRAGPKPARAGSGRRDRFVAVAVRDQLQNSPGELAASLEGDQVLVLCGVAGVNERVRRESEFLECCLDLRQKIGIASEMALALRAERGGIEEGVDEALVAVRARRGDDLQLDRRGPVLRRALVAVAAELELARDRNIRKIVVHLRSSLLFV